MTVIKNNYKLQSSKQLETMDNYNNYYYYLNIDWERICEDHNIKQGDISPEQSLKIDNALDSVNQVVEAFINQNKTK